MSMILKRFAKGLDVGFALFGKESRDFCFLFQVIFHKKQSKAFYLHTLMAHARHYMWVIYPDFSLDLNRFFERKHFIHF